MYVEAILEAESANQAVGRGVSGENCVDQKSTSSSRSSQSSRARPHNNLRLCLAKVLMVGAQRAQPHLLGAPGHVLKPRKPSAGERAKAAAAHRTATDGAPHHAVKSWPKSASAHNDATCISSAELRRMTPSESAALGLPARRTPLNTPRKSETPRTSAYTDPPGELVLGARHAGMYTAAQGGLSAVSVAHTWHAVMDGHPTAVAGEEGIVTLHVGQPSKASSLVMPPAHLSLIHI